MDITLYGLATRYVGVREFAGDADHPLIRWWLSLCGFDPVTTHDEVPWCSAFINGLCWELRLPRSKSAKARSWLTVGSGVPLEVAHVGYDVVVLSRDSAGPEAGHVGLYAGRAHAGPAADVLLLGGNQGDQVRVSAYDASRVLGVRRLGP